MSDFWSRVLYLVAVKMVAGLLFWGPVGLIWYVVKRVREERERSEFYKMMTGDEEATKAYRRRHAND